MRLRTSLAILLISSCVLSAGERKKVQVTSTIDGVRQTCYVILPDGFDAEGEPVPLLVSLHSWSRDVEYRNTVLEAEANRRGWIYLFPNFRGPNNHPDACGSLKAQQDILDAVAWAQQHYPVDRRRIYLTGASGGGHMTMLMVGRHPDIWAAASAWVGVSDLTSWHRRHDALGTKYAKMMERSCGGRPGDSPEVDKQYRQRSPITHMHRAAKVPVDIVTGIHDGHKGSVPIRHSLDAFNALAKATGAKTISKEEIAQLSRPNGRLDKPQPSDLVEDSSLSRRIHLRRTAGPSRVTVFEGGHEAHFHAAAEWLAAHAKPD